MHTDIANKLISKVEGSQDSLLGNDTLYAAIFLDLRFRRSLFYIKQDVSKRHLKKLFYKMQRLEKVNNF